MQLMLTGLRSKLTELLRLPADHAEGVECALAREWKISAYPLTEWRVAEPLRVSAALTPMSALRRTATIYLGRFADPSRYRADFVAPTRIVGFDGETVWEWKLGDTL